MENFKIAGTILAKKKEKTLEQVSDPSYTTGKRYHEYFW